MVEKQRHNRSIVETEKEGKCANCIMNTICTVVEKIQKQKTGKCPSSVKGMGNMVVKESNKQEPVDMIPVVKMEYWDGSKYIFRTDKAGYKRKLCKLRVTMRSRFLALPKEEQIEIAQKQNMLRRTEEMMSEKVYLKIRKE